MYRWPMIILFCALSSFLYAEEEKAGVVPEWTWAQNVADTDASIRYPAWIWRHTGREQELDKRYFSKQFELPAGSEISTAWLRATCDNAYILYVNGQLVGSDEWWQSVEYWDIRPFLKEGVNTISVEAWDFGGAAGLYLFGEINTAKETIAIKSDSSWDCTLKPAADWLASSAGEDTQKARTVQEGVAPDSSVIDWSKDHPESIAAFLKVRLGEPGRTPFPVPQQMTLVPTYTVLPFDLSIEADSPLAEFAAGQLAGVLRSLDSRFAPGAGSRKIRLTGSAGSPLPDQAYRIKAGGEGDWLITADSKAGFIYGVWSFLQLIGRDGEHYTVPAAEINDYPDVALRGIVDGQLSPEMFDWMSFYKINAIKLYLNYTVPPSKSLAQVQEYAVNRGIRLIVCLHPPTLFSFQPDSEDMQFLMKRIEDIRDLGFRELCILQDDYPNETAGADRQTYGEGLEGLVLAQSYMMKEVMARFGKQFERVIFMPRVYFDPQVMGPYPAVEGYPGHINYRAKLGDYTLFAPEIEMYTTRGNPEYLAKLRKITGRRNHVFQNYNEAALAGFQVHFEPYPVVPRRILGDICGLWLNGADSPMPFEFWHVNYLSFAENTWNIAKPVGLERAFAEKYGAQYAEMLCRYAELMGGHRNIVGTMEDFWWLPEKFATRVLHDEVNLANPTAADLRRFAVKAANCRAALQLVLDSGLPHEAKDELGSSAIRLANLFEIKIAVEQVRDLIARMEAAPPAERKPLADQALKLIDEATVKARATQEIIRKMRLFYTAIIPDYSYVGYLQQLLKRDVEAALANTNCVRNGNFELMKSEKNGNLSELKGWTRSSVKGGMVRRGEMPAMSGRNCLEMRPNSAGETDSWGVIQSDLFVCSGSTLEWAQASQKGGATNLTVRILDASRKVLFSQEFSPASSQFAMERIDVSKFKGQQIRLEFRAGTREKGMGWVTGLDAVSIR